MSSPWKELNELSTQRQTFSLRMEVRRGEMLISGNSYWFLGEKWASASHKAFNPYEKFLVIPMILWIKYMLEEGRGSHDSPVPEPEKSSLENQWDWLFSSWDSIALSALYLYKFLWKERKAPSEVLSMFPWEESIMEQEWGKKTVIGFSKDY